MCKHNYKQIFKYEIDEKTIYCAKRCTLCGEEKIEKEYKKRLKSPKCKDTEIDLYLSNIATTLSYILQNFDDEVLKKDLAEKIVDFLEEYKR